MDEAENKIIDAMAQALALARHAICLKQLPVELIVKCLADAGEHYAMHKAMREAIIDRVINTQDTATLHEYLKSEALNTQQSNSREGESK